MIFSLALVAFSLTINQPLHLTQKVFYHLYRSPLPIDLQHVTLTRNLTQLCSINKIVLIEHLFIIPRFFKLCDIAYDFFSLC